MRQGSSQRMQSSCGGHLICFRSRHMATIELGDDGEELINAMSTCMPAADRLDALACELRSQPLVTHQRGQGRAHLAAVARVEIAVGGKQLFDIAPGS